MKSKNFSVGVPLSGKQPAPTRKLSRGGKHKGSSKPIKIQHRPRGASKRGKRQTDPQAILDERNAHKKGFVSIEEYSWMSGRARERFWFLQCVTRTET